MLACLRPVICLDNVIERRWCMTSVDVCITQSQGTVTSCSSCSVSVGVGGGLMTSSSNTTDFMSTETTGNRSPAESAAVSSSTPESFEFAASASPAVMGPETENVSSADAPSGGSWRRRFRLLPSLRDILFSSDRRLPVPDRRSAFEWARV